MREIQDMTIQSVGRAQDIDKLFLRQKEKARTLLSAYVDKFESDERDRVGVYMLRVTAIPSEPLHIGRLHNNQAGIPQILRFNGQVNHGKSVEVRLVREPDQWRPVLRGTHGQGYRDKESWIDIEVLEGGLIEISLTWGPGPEGLVLFPTWLLGLSCNVLANIEAIRTGANSPGVEYELELELIVRNAPLSVLQVSHLTPRETLARLPIGTHSLVRYSVGPLEDFGQLNKLLQQDFWDLAGESNAPIYEVDFQPGLG